MKSLLAFCVIALLTAPALAQPTVEWWTVDGGGGMSGGDWVLTATAAQPDATVMSGGLFQLSGGFWPGSIPAGPACGTADFNGDGDAGTDADIEAFFACLAGDCCPTCFGSDFNADGDTGTDADIEAFFRVLAGGAC